jgi:hypothetical protein
VANSESGLARLHTGPNDVTTLSRNLPLGI